MQKAVKSMIRKLLFRSKVFRYLAGLGSMAVGRSQPIGISHLSFYREHNVAGAAQQEEALFLFALTKLCVPSVVVEFGFLSGHTAFNFIQAGSPDMRLYSYDISDEAHKKATTDLGCLKNLTFLHKSQTDFDPRDIGNQLIDLVFIDASHVLSLNQITWKKLLPSLAPAALVVVHDTGTWSADLLSPQQRETAKEMPDCWLNAQEFQREKEERQFVNWLQAEYPDFGAIHLHTLKKIRNGFTVLQRQCVLPTEQAAPLAQGA